jgi:hypothetical protein
LPAWWCLNILCASGCWPDDVWMSLMAITQWMFVLFVLL